MIIDDIDDQKDFKHPTPSSPNTAAHAWNEALKNLRIKNWRGIRNESGEYKRIDLTKQQALNIIEKFASDFYPIIESHPRAKYIQKIYETWKEISNCLMKIQYPTKQQITIFQENIDKFFENFCNTSFGISPYIHILKRHTISQFQKYPSLINLSTQANEADHKNVKVDFFGTQHGTIKNRLRQVIERQARQYCQKADCEEEIEIMNPPQIHHCKKCGEVGHTQKNPKCPKYYDSEEGPKRRKFE